MNGFQVCRRLKTDPQHARIPVVLLTVRDSEADRFWGTEVGCDLYLAKPMDPGGIVLQVQQVIGAEADRR
jgi:DNA-binding response OmpR family regulator